jgi:hypothetical protein
VLQFGGSSSRAICHQEVKRAWTLRLTGTFDGIYRHNETSPASATWTVQAIWERQRATAAVSQPRYDKPVMDQAGYEWVPSADQPGVFEKLLGVFTERRSEAGIVLVNAGATLTGSGRGIYLAFGVANGRRGALRPDHPVPGRGEGFVVAEQVRLCSVADLRGLREPTYAAKRSGCPIAARGCSS